MSEVVISLGIFTVVPEALDTKVAIPYVAGDLLPQPLNAGDQFNVWIIVVTVCAVLARPRDETTSPCVPVYGGRFSTPVQRALKIRKEPFGERYVFFPTIQCDNKTKESIVSTAARTRGTRR